MEDENKPDTIKKAISQGYNVEIDVWKVNNVLYLGHDSPMYEIHPDFLDIQELWCHAKNLSAFEYMLSKNVRCFWHEEDDYTLTSDGFIWTYPNKDVVEKSVIVCKTLEETVNYSKSVVYGICSDYVEMVKK